MRKLFFATAVALTALCAQAQINSPGNEGYRLRGELMFIDDNYVGTVDQMVYLNNQDPTPAQREAADFYLAMSNAHLNSRDADVGLRMFLRKYPASQYREDVIITLGDLCLDRGLYDQALEQYNRMSPHALDMAAQNHINFNRAFCYLKKGELDPSNGRANYAKATSLLVNLARKKSYAAKANFYLGYIALCNRDYAGVEKYMELAKKDKQLSPVADYYLAQMYFADGKFDKAGTLATNVLQASAKANPKSPAGRLGKQFNAEMLRIAGESAYHGNSVNNVAEAAKYLTRYEQMTATPAPTAMYILGIADYESGDDDRMASALAHLAPATRMDNAMGQNANLLVGQILMGERKYSEAAIAFDRALKMDHDPKVQETAYYNYAVANTNGGKVPFGSSVTVFEEFLRKFPNSKYAAEVREYIIPGYMTDNNYQAALASIEAVNNPSDKVLKAKQQVLYTLGSRELKSGETRIAIERLRQAKALSSYNSELAAETDLWLGEALYADGQYNAAADCFNSYIAAARKSGRVANLPVALYDLAYARFSAKNYKDALTDFSRFLSQPGTSSKETIADAYSRLADCNYNNNNISQAALYYKKAYEVSPSTGDYPLFMDALMAGLQRNYETKIAGLRSMINKFPHSALVGSAYLEMGEAFEQLKQHEKAIESYSVCASRYPSTQQGRQANLLLALAYIQAGNNQQAVDTYKRLIVNAPTSREAQQAMQNLKVMMSDEGKILEFNDFVGTVPGFQQMEASELEALAFSSAEKEYLTRGLTSRLEEYLARYTNGEHRPEALAYGVRATMTVGDYSRALDYATELIDKYPDSQFVEDGLNARAEIEFNQGNGEAALVTYNRLLEKASSPAMSNIARMGILRTAGSLGRNDLAVETADALLASSTITADQRDEAHFIRALANSLNGKTDAAESEWRDLATDMTKLYGTKAAYYIAEQHFRLGNYATAGKAAEKLLESKSPFNYWIARAYILKADVLSKQGNANTARDLLEALRANYRGPENDIPALIDQRLR